MEKVSVSCRLLAPSPLGDLLLKMGGVGRVLRATLQYEKMHTNARNAAKTKTRDEPKDKVHRGRHSGLSGVRKIGPSAPTIVRVDAESATQLSTCIDAFERD